MRLLAIGTLVAILPCVVAGQSSPPFAGLRQNAGRAQFHSEMP
jgi:hypothetical protein